MRDPGTPRRNPFFERDSDGAAGDLGMGWRERADDREPDPAADGRGGAAGTEGGVGGFATLLALVDGLSDAQPEAAEHFVAAAHEVVLTVKVLVDATEAVLAQQRAAMAERSAMARDAAATAAEPTAGSDASGEHSVSWLHPDGGS